MQITAACSIVRGAMINSDSICTISFVEGDGELKILQCKEFSDPQKFRDFHSAMDAVEGNAKMPRFKTQSRD